MMYDPAQAFLDAKETFLKTTVRVTTRVGYYDMIERMLRPEKVEPPKPQRYRSRTVDVEVSFEDGVENYLNERETHGSYRSERASKIDQLRLRGSDHEEKEREEQRRQSITLDCYPVELGMLLEVGGSFEIHDWRRIPMLVEELMEFETIQERSALGRINFGTTEDERFMGYIRVLIEELTPIADGIRQGFDIRSLINERISIYTGPDNGVVGAIDMEL
jgi:hypothetical protein